MRQNVIFIPTLTLVPSEKSVIKQVKIEQELPFARKPTLIPAVTASQTVFKVVFYDGHRHYIL